MNKNMRIISLLFVCATAPLFALDSLDDIFNNPRIASVSPELNNATYRSEIKKGLMEQVESPYNELNTLLGDATIHACEESLEKTLCTLFRSAITNTVQATDYALLVETYNKLYGHLDTKKTDSNKNAITQFMALIIARRITIAGLAFSIEHAGKQMTQLQQSQCQAMLQKVNDITMDFMIQKLGLPLVDEEAAAPQA